MPPFLWYFQNVFLNINITLLLHVLKSEVFIGGGGGGGKTRPSLSEFSGSTPDLDTQYNIKC